MSAYVYVRSEPGLYTVGFYDPAGRWVSDSDHDTKDLAANRVAFLNGNANRLTPAAPALRTALSDLLQAIGAARTVKVPAGDWDADIYYNSADFGTAQSVAWKLLKGLEEQP